MKISAWGQTDKGLRRESNQDSYLLSEELGLFIVADGMGGHSGGEVASALAVKSAENYIRTNISRLSSHRDLVANAYIEACRQIYDKANNESPDLMGMGTTMVLLFAKGKSVFVANVGDSRIYLHRKPHLWQVTEDHSLVYEQLRDGTIKENQLKSFVGKNVITRSVGYEREVNVDVLERPLMDGDRFLLCSDGLCGLVNDDTICAILNNMDREKAVEECIKAALENGGDDNVTVVLVEIGINS
jgi:protein phosphatase